MGVKGVIVVIMLWLVITLPAVDAALCNDLSFARQTFINNFKEKTGVEPSVAQIKIFFDVYFTKLFKKNFPKIDAKKTVDAIRNIPTTARVQEHILEYAAETFNQLSEEEIIPQQEHVASLLDQLHESGNPINDLYTNSYFLVDKLVPEEKQTKVLKELSEIRKRFVSNKDDLLSFLGKKSLDLELSRLNSQQLQNTEIISLINWRRTATAKQLSDLLDKIENLLQKAHEQGYAYGRLSEYTRQNDIHVVILSDGSVVPLLTGWQGTGTLTDVGADDEGYIKFREEQFKEQKIAQQAVYQFPALSSEVTISEVKTKYPTITPEPPIDEAELSQIQSPIIVVTNSDVLVDGISFLDVANVENLEPTRSTILKKLETLTKSKSAVAKRLLDSSLDSKQLEQLEKAFDLLSDSFETVEIFATRFIEPQTGWNAYLERGKANIFFNGKQLQPEQLQEFYDTLGRTALNGLNDVLPEVIDSADSSNTARLRKLLNKVQQFISELPTANEFAPINTNLLQSLIKEPTQLQSFIEQLTPTKALLAGLASGFILVGLHALGLYASIAISSMLIGAGLQFYERYTGKKLSPILSLARTIFITSSTGYALASAGMPVIGLGISLLPAVSIARNIIYSIYNTSIAIKQWWTQRQQAKQIVQTKTVTPSFLTRLASGIITPIASSTVLFSLAVNIIIGTPKSFLGTQEGFISVLKHATGTSTTNLRISSTTFDINTPTLAHTGDIGRTMSAIEALKTKNWNEFFTQKAWDALVSKFTQELQGNTGAFAETLLEQIMLDPEMQEFQQSLKSISITEEESVRIAAVFAGELKTKITALFSKLNMQLLTQQGREDFSSGLAQEIHSAALNTIAQELPELLSGLRFTERIAIKGAYVDVSFDKNTARITASSPAAQLNLQLPFSPTQAIVTEKGIALDTKAGLTGYITVHVNGEPLSIDLSKGKFSTENLIVGEKVLGKIVLSSPLTIKLAGPTKIFGIEITKSVEITITSFSYDLTTGEVGAELYMPQANAQNKEFATELSLTEAKVSITANTQTGASKTELTATARGTAYDKKLANTALKVIQETKEEHELFSISTPQGEITGQAQLTLELGTEQEPLLSARAIINEEEKNKEKTQEPDGLQVTTLIDSEIQGRKYNAIVTHTSSEGKTTTTLAGTSTDRSGNSQPFEISVAYEQLKDKTRKIDAKLTGDIGAVISQVFENSPVKSPDGKVRAEVQISPEGKLTVTQLDITTLKTTKIKLEKATTLEIGSMRVTKPADMIIAATTGEVIVENIRDAELNDVKFTDTNNPKKPVQVNIKKIIVQGNARFSLGNKDKNIAAQNQVPESVLETIRTLFGGSNLNIDQAIVTLNPDGSVATVDIIGEGIKGELAINKDLVKGRITSTQHVHAILVNGKVSTVTLRNVNVEELNVDSTALHNKGLSRLNNLELRFAQQGVEQENRLVWLSATGRVSGTTRVAGNGFVSENLELTNLELTFGDQGLENIIAQQVNADKATIEEKVGLENAQIKGLDIKLVQTPKGKRLQSIAAENADIQGSFSVQDGLSSLTAKKSVVQNLHAEFNNGELLSVRAEKADIKQELTIQTKAQTAYIMEKPLINDLSIDFTNKKLALVSTGHMTVQGKLMLGNELSTAQANIGALQVLAGDKGVSDILVTDIESQGAIEGKESGLRAEAGTQARIVGVQFRNGKIARIAINTGTSPEISVGTGIKVTAAKSNSIQILFDNNGQPKQAEIENARTGTTRVSLENVIIEGEQGSIDEVKLLFTNGQFNSATRLDVKGAFSLYEKNKQGEKGSELGTGSVEEVTTGNRHTVQVEFTFTKKPDGRVEKLFLEFDLDTQGSVANVHGTSTTLFHGIEIGRKQLTLEKAQISLTDQSVTQGTGNKLRFSWLIHGVGFGQVFADRTVVQQIQTAKGVQTRTAVIQGLSADVAMSRTDSAGLLQSLFGANTQRVAIASIEAPQLEFSLDELKQLTELTGQEIPKDIIRRAKGQIKIKTYFIDAQKFKKASEKLGTLAQEYAQAQQDATPEKLAQLKQKLAQDIDQVMKQADAELITQDNDVRLEGRAEQYDEFKNKVINTLINQLLSRGPLLIFDSFFGSSGKAGVMTALDALRNNAGFTTTFMEQLKSQENTDRIPNKEIRNKIQKKLSEQTPLTWQEEIELLKAVLPALSNPATFDLQVKEAVNEAIKNAEILRQEAAKTMAVMRETARNALATLTSKDPKEKANIELFLEAELLPIIHSDKELPRETIMSIIKQAGFSPKQQKIIWEALWLSVPSINKNNPQPEELSPRKTNEEKVTHPDKAESIKTPLSEDAAYKETLSVAKRIAENKGAVEELLDLLTKENREKETLSIRIDKEGKTAGQYLRRIELAEVLFGRPLNSNERTALIDAHLSAGIIGKLSTGQLLTKDKKLVSNGKGFDSQDNPEQSKIERRKLIESGLAGETGTAKSSTTATASVLSAILSTVSLVISLVLLNNDDPFAAERQLGAASIFFGISGAGVLATLVLLKLGEKQSKQERLQHAIGVEKKRQEFALKQFEDRYTAEKNIAELAYLGANGDESYRARELWKNVNQYLISWTSSFSGRVDASFESPIYEDFKTFIKNHEKEPGFNANSYARYYRWEGLNLYSSLPDQSAIPLLDILLNPPQFVTEEELRGVENILFEHLKTMKVFRVVAANSVRALEESTIPLISLFERYNARVTELLARAPAERSSREIKNLVAIQQILQKLYSEILSSVAYFKTESDLRAAQNRDAEHGQTVLRGGHSLQALGITSSANSFFVDAGLKFETAMRPYVLHAERLVRALDNKEKSIPELSFFGILDDTVLQKAGFKIGTGQIDSEQIVISVVYDTKEQKVIPLPIKQGQLQSHTEFVSSLLGVGSTEELLNHPERQRYIAGVIVLTAKQIPDKVQGILVDDSGTGFNKLVGLLPKSTVAQDALYAISMYAQSYKREISKKKSIDAATSKTPNSEQIQNTLKERAKLQVELIPIALSVLADVAGFIELIEEAGQGERAIRYAKMERNLADIQSLLEQALETIQSYLAGEAAIPQDEAEVLLNAVGTGIQGFSFPQAEMATISKSLLKLRSEDVSEEVLNAYYKKNRVFIEEAVDAIRGIISVSQKNLEKIPDKKQQEATKYWRNKKNTPTAFLRNIFGRAKKEKEITQPIIITEKEVEAFTFALEMLAPDMWYHGPEEHLIGPGPDVGNFAGKIQKHFNVKGKFEGKDVRLHVFVQ